MDAKTFALDRYNFWLSEPVFDTETKEELKNISANESEIIDRFYKNLEFGTAGLRGIIGAGDNRMNYYTVRRASQGLSNYISSVNANARGVVIAYDSRIMSPEFALCAALTFAANNIKAYLFDELRPTPELSFAVRYLGAIAGVNITASHNPPKYNGYKVYWEDGAQITPPASDGIIAAVNAIESYDQARTMEEAAAREAGLLVNIGKEIDDAYVAAVKSQVKCPEALKSKASEIKVVYTPLHGAGNKLVQRVLSELGFTKLYVVPEQEAPDGHFPTVAYPNPEDEKVFVLALELAKKVDADVVLATDPDSDRLGMYVKDSDGNYHSLSGNVSGALLADYEVGRLADASKLPVDGRIISTIVTGKLGRAVANYYKTDYIETLTGFKYIGEQIKLMDESGKGSYLFGYEESYGCLIGTYARDKDAVVATMAICEAACYYATKGMNMWDAVIALFDKLGYYAEAQSVIAGEGYEGMQMLKALMESLRARKPESIGDFKVLKIRDYKTSESMDMLSGQTEALMLPKSDVLYYELPDDAWIAIRPSGTEPKVKTYYGVKGSSFEDAQAKQAALKNAIEIFMKN